MHLSLPRIAALGAALLLPSLARGQALAYSRAGVEAMGKFGSSVAVVRDMDGDGGDDVLVGEPKYRNLNEGRVAFLNGRTGVEFRSYAGVQDMQAGAAVAGFPDVTGDGVPEFLVGTPLWQGGGGGVWLRNGVTTGQIWSFTVVGGGLAYGETIAVLDDLNGDGIPEVAAGAPDKASYSVLNGATGVLIYGIVDPAGTTRHGAAIARTDDYSGDGVGDFIVGAPDWDDTVLGKVDCGRIVVSDAVTGFPLFFVGGDASFAHLGASVAGLGDLNGDGIGEFAAGAPGTLVAGQQTGLVRVWSGYSFGVLRDTFGAAGDNLGFSLAAMGDLNGDAIDDYLTGSPASNGGLGLARVISGASNTSLVTFLGTFIFNRALGWAVAGGDVNGDGVADVAITDPDHGPTVSQALGQVAMYVGCPASATTYGTGWPGKLGVPTLTAAQEPTVGGPLVLDLTNSLGATTPALLFLGAAPASIQGNSGATLLVTPAFRFLLSVPAAGLSLGTTLDGDPALCGFHLYAQALEADPFAVGGVSYTAGLDLAIGFDLP